MNPPQLPPTRTRITIEDVDIPFGRLILILLKFMVASIPALIAFYVLTFCLILFFAVIFGGGAAFLEALWSR